MANRTIGTPVVAGYLVVWWGAVAAFLVWASTNTAPAAPTLSWGDDVVEANTTTRLGVAVTPAIADADGEPIDVDGDALNFFFSWTLDGAPLDNTGRSINNRETRKGQVYEVTVTPDDGTLGGSLCFLPWRECAGGPDSVARLSITIGNAPPRARARVEDEEGEAIETVERGKPVVAQLGCSDPDIIDEKTDALLAAEAAGEPPPPPPAPPVEGEEPVKPEDPCTYRVAWLKDVEEVPKDAAEIDFEAAEFKEPTLPATATRERGTKWTLAVVASDGEDEGPLFTTSVWVSEE